MQLTLRLGTFSPIHRGKMCDGVETLEGCGYCTYGLFEDDLMTKISLRSVSRLCLYLSASDNISNFTVNRDLTKCTCRGSLTVYWEDSRFRTSRTVMRKNVDTIKALLHGWTSINSAFQGSILSLHLQSVYDELDKLKGKERLMTILGTLSYTLGEATSMNGTCTSINEHKEMGCCMFKLSDLRSADMINTPWLIVDAIVSTIRRLPRKSGKGLCFDLNSAGIMCDGTILPSKYVLYTTDIFSFTVMQICNIIRYMSNSFSTFSRLSPGVMIDIVRRSKNLLEVDTVLTNYSRVANYIP